MRVLIQRVESASVEVDGRVTGAIHAGFLLLTGITHDDTAEIVSQMAEKIANLRVFEDDAGKLNLSARDRIESGEPTGMLVVSQFTLYGDVHKGRRPSFKRAASPSTAEPLIDLFASRLAAMDFTIGQGVFGAQMKVSLLNDGPVTIWIDSDELGDAR